MQQTYTEGKEDRKPHGRHKGKHDKDKPWDDPSIDHWKIEKFDPSWNEGGMVEMTSFSIRFPQYREKYLQEWWPTVRGALKEHGIACELDLVEGLMTVTTTLKTRDPYIIVKARDLIKLLSRSVPTPQALKILNDEMQYDIIKISNLVRTKKRFVRRRQLLVGPDSITLKGLEHVTGCYILAQGSTVAAMGSFKGLKQVRKVVEQCMLNKTHPAMSVVILKIKRGLAENPALANESWDRYLPIFKKRNVKRKKVRTKEKKPYTPFPPPQLPSKVDLQLESGEYFLSDKKKRLKKWHEKQERQAKKTTESKRKREEVFVPPKELMKDMKEHVDDNNDVAQTTTMSLKKKAKDYRKQRWSDNIDPEAYIAAAAMARPTNKKSKKS